LLKGVNLSLMIGPAVPVAVSKDVLDALAGVQVTTSVDGPSAFQLTFNLRSRSPLQTLFMLSGGANIPLMRVIVAVSVNGSTDVLIDGVMTNHQYTPGPSGTDTLTITGEDLTRVMDYIDLSGIPYPCMPAEARVAIALAKYLVLGVVPVVIPSLFVDIPIPTTRIPYHQGTDLQYVKALAEQVGYVFYHEPGPTPGSSFAYWGPEVKIGTPQSALNINMDSFTNVETLNFSFNTDKAKLPLVWIQEPISKAPIPIPIPNVGILNPPLGVVPPIPMEFVQLDKGAKFSIPQALLFGVAKAGTSAESVTANGSLNVLRYGRVLKARKLVGVRGAGDAFDGLYYVRSVTHNVKRGEYKQSFSLSRSGLLSTIPKVPV
jgi:hypothetical protein